MDTNQAVSCPTGMQPGPNGNGNGNGHKSRHLEDPESYLSQSEAGLAHGKDDGFQEGYRTGYLDGFLHGLKQSSSGAATNGNSSAASRSDARTRAKADHREQRLKGFPCAVCGCASYSDETHCPCCGTAKDSSARHPEQGPESSVAHD